MNTSTATATIEKLRLIFATHGIPSICVLDNGPSFVSDEFKTFLRNNGIRQVLVAPYHPSSNGLAERAVQTFKSSMTRSTNASINTRVSRFLFTYRITPHTSTGKSPAELLMNRKLRSNLDLIKPSLHQKMIHATGAKWLPGIITKINGPLSYEVKTENKDIKCHIDQLQKRELSKRGIEQIPFDIELPETPTNLTPNIIEDPTSEIIQNEQSDQTVMLETSPVPVTTPTMVAEVVTDENNIKSRLRCSIRPPSYLKDYV